MKKYFLFLKYGLSISLAWECINNFLITFAPWNFIFACIFYIGSLSLVFLFYTRFFSSHFPRFFYLYICITSLWIGLVLNEWIIVGNTIYNSNVDNIISQISMLSFHLALYTTPVLLVFTNGFKKVYLKMMFWLLWVWFIALVFLLSWLHNLVLPWAIFMWYFIWYNVYSIKILLYVARLKKEV